MKFVHTKRRFIRAIRAIFGWNISLISETCFRISKRFGQIYGKNTTRKFQLRMRVDVHSRRFSSTLPFRVDAKLLRACCHAISVKMMKVYPQPQVKFW